MDLGSNGVLGLDRAFRLSSILSSSYHGTPQRHIPCLRELRQDDPLSPLLSMLMMEGFTQMLRIAYDQQLISGFKADRGSKQRQVL